jgi:hypothetical protein
MTVTRMVLALPPGDRYRARAMLTAGDHLRGRRHRQRDQPTGEGLQQRPLSGDGWNGAEGDPGRAAAGRRPGDQRPGALAPGVASAAR